MDNSFNKLVDIIRQLRSPEGCPWDRKQTPESIINNLIEEAYEVNDAVLSGDTEDVIEEIGDIYLVAVMLSVIFEEQKLFTPELPLQVCADKLVRRHPHVFGELSAADDDEVMKIWQQEKDKEKKNKSQDSINDGISSALPALIKANKIQKKASAKGFDWEEHDIDSIFDKLHEEINELKEAIISNDQSDIEEECGDILFSSVNLCRFLKVDPHMALEKTNLKFIRRFDFITDNAEKPLSEMSLDEMEILWQKAKQHFKK
jgi:MazG family protein